MSLKTIKDGVIALISSVANGSAVTEKVTAALAQEELSRRAGILTKAYAAFGVLQKNFDNINKADTVLSNTDGVKMEFFTDKRKGEIAKVKNQLDKLEAAVANAIGDQAKWDELEKALQNPVKESESSKASGEF